MDNEIINELKKELKELIFEASLGVKSLSDFDDNNDLSSQLGVILKQLSETDDIKSTKELVKNVFMEGYKLGFSVNSSLNNTTSLSFDRIIYCMKDKGLSKEEISEYLGITADQVEQMLKKSILSK